MAAKVDRREFLLKAHPSKRDELIGGWFVSEKLDGIRCLWDGGISRDCDCSDVPYANPKSHGTRATGLWTGYANPIYAPDWFLNTLPCIPLDGELWKGRRQFQATSSAVRKLVPVDTEWKGVEFKIFSTPSFKALFKTALVKNQFFELLIDSKLCQAFLKKYKHDDVTCIHDDATFHEELTFLDRGYLTGNPTCSLHTQFQLPQETAEAWEVVEKKFEAWVKLGCEGAMVRDPNSVWNPKREHFIVKVKPCLDDEATVIGFTAGKEGKTGKFLGMIGNIVLKLDNGKVFEVSGFENPERELRREWRSWAKLNPGKTLSTELGNLHGEFSDKFPLGTRITFKYRELSDTGIPKEARYLRIRPDGE